MTTQETRPATGAAQDAATVAATYFRAWKANDWTTLRSVLADDATFRGPLGSADDAEACMQGLKGTARIMTDIIVHERFVEDGRITTIRVTFDARPLALPAAG